MNDPNPENPQPTAPLARTPWFIALIIALLAAALYLPSLRYGYVYDDVAIIQADERLESPSFILDLWTAPWWPRGSDAPATRPITTLTFWLQTQLHARNAPAYHAVNVILYALLCALTALLTLRLTNRPWCAWIAGLTFAAHPIHVEVAANLVGRAELLAAIFVIAAILAWHRWRAALTWPKTAALAALILAAGLSKEHGYLAAPILCAFQFAYARRDRAPILKAPTLHRVLIAITLVVLIGAAQRYAMLQQAEIKAGQVAEMDNPLVGATTAQRIVTPFLLVGRAVQLMCLAGTQSPDYSPRVLMPTSSLAGPLVIVGLLTTIIWVSALIRAFKQRLASFAALLAVGFAWLIPSNTVLLIGTIFGERLLTLCSVFIPIALLWTIAESLDRRAQKSPTSAPGKKKKAKTHASNIPPTHAIPPRVLLIALPAALITLIAAFQTIAYAEAAWSSPQQQLTYVTERVPNSGRFLAFSAVHVVDLIEENRHTFPPGGLEGFLDEAETQALAALENWPRQTKPYEALAFVNWERAKLARRQNRPDFYEAHAGQARQYAQLAQRSAETAHRAARVLREMGLQEDPAQLARRIAQLESRHAESPDDPQLTRQLAHAYLRARRHEDARPLYARLITPQTKDPDLFEQYTSVLISLGKLTDALDIYEQWLTLEPNNWSVLSDAAMIALTISQKLPQARAWLESAARISPNSGEPWAGLARWHEIHNDPDTAEKMYRRAIEVTRPEDPKRAHYKQLLEALKK